jgi:hypothetical protein
MFRRQQGAILRESSRKKRMQAQHANLGIVEESLTLAPTAETCRSLKLVMNCILLSAFLVGVLSVRTRARLQWSRDSVLAFRTQSCGFEPGRNRRIF